MTELALASVVLILILLGVVDFARVYQFQTALMEAAREGARQAANYDGNVVQNPFEEDAAIKSVVDTVLHGAGLPNSSLQSPGTCIGSGLAHGPSFPAADFPNSINSPSLYICYNTSTGKPTNLASPPDCSTFNADTAPNSPLCGGQDLEVVLLMKFGLVVQTGPFGPSQPLVGYAHMRVQGS